MKTCVNVKQPGGAKLQNDSLVMNWLNWRLCIMSFLVLSYSTTFANEQALTSASERAAKIHWQNVEYELSAGVEVLSDAIFSKNLDVKTRVAALEILGRVALAIKGSALVQKLMELYATVSLEEKAAILFCLVNSDDPRTGGLFSDIIIHEDNPQLRLFAGVGLAKWRIKDGVMALANLLEHTIPDSPNSRSVAESALIELSSLKYLRDLGFQEILTRTAEQRKENPVAVSKIIIAWCEEHSEIFINWKPGDPLPSVEVQAPSEKPVENP